MLTIKKLRDLEFKRISLSEALRKNREERDKKNKKNDKEEEAEFQSLASTLKSKDQTRESVVIKET